MGKEQPMGITTSTPNLHHLVTEQDLEGKNGWGGVAEEPGAEENLLYDSFSQVWSFPKINNIASVSDQKEEKAKI